MARHRYGGWYLYTGDGQYNPLPKSLVPHRAKIATAGTDRDNRWEIEFTPGWEYEDCHSTFVSDLREAARHLRDLEPCPCQECLLSILGEDLAPLIQTALFGDPGSMDVVCDALEERGRADVGHILKFGTYLP